MQLAKVGREARAKAPVSATTVAKRATSNAIALSYKVKVGKVATKAAARETKRAAAKEKVSRVSATPVAPRAIPPEIAGKAKVRAATGMARRVEKEA